MIFSSLLFSSLLFSILFSIQNEDLLFSSLFKMKMKDSDRGLSGLLALIIRVSSSRNVICRWGGENMRIWNNDVEGV